MTHKYKVTEFRMDAPYKAKANPLQTWTGPEDSRRMNITDFKSIGT